jgi:uncharacterized iron-regulated membrane protein
MGCTGPKMNEDAHDVDCRRPLPALAPGKPERMTARTLHRSLAVVALLIGLYVGGTGTLLQLIDLRTLAAHPPASDPDLRALREGRDGPQNFRVLVEADYAAAPLPPAFDYDAALATVLQARQAAIGAAPIAFLELRMLDGRPVGQVNARGRLLRFDARSGEVLIGAADAPPVTLPPGSQPATRNTVKNIHRITAFGELPTFLDVAVGVVLFMMLLTGLLQYFRLLGARRRAGRGSPFWSAGGAWRNVHRGLATIAAAFLLIVVLSGTLLAVGDAGVSVYRMTHDGKRPGLTVDASAPLDAAELPGMLHTTLAAYREGAAQRPLRVVRLRYFAGMPQGVVVTADEDARQLAFDTRSGRRASLSGDDYPVTGQPFGWQENQIVKAIHRGDVIGLPGRWLNLLAGLALLFLSVSGATLYFSGRKRSVAART